MTRVSEGAAAGSPKASWVFMLPSRKRTGFGPQAPSGKALHFRGLPPPNPKTRTGMGPHPNPTPTHTSAEKRGYVRSPDLIDYANPMAGFDPPIRWSEPSHPANLSSPDFG